MTKKGSVSLAQELDRNQADEGMRQVQEWTEESGEQERRADWPVGRAAEADGGQVWSEKKKVWKSWLWGGEEEVTPPPHKENTTKAEGTMTTDYMGAAD